MLGRGTDKIWPLVDKAGLLWVPLLLAGAGAPPKKKHCEEIPVWGHGETYSTAKHGDPRASAYAGLQPMDLVSQLSFVALSRGKVMLKHPINSRHCLGGFSVSSLMQYFQFTLDFTWWSSWRLRSSPNRYDTTPGKNVLSPPHWHSRPKFLFTRTALKSIQNQNSPWVPWFFFFCVITLILQAKSIQNLFEMSRKSYFL